MRWLPFKRMKRRKRELRCACCIYRKSGAGCRPRTAIWVMGSPVRSHPPYSFDKTCRTVWIIAFSRSPVIGFCTESMTIFS